VINELARKRDLARALFERRLRLAREDVAAFVELCVRDQVGNRLTVEPFQRQWILHVDYCWKRNLRAIVLAPWSFGKTSTLSIPILAWSIGRNPHVRIKIISNDLGNAMKRATAVKKIIESPLYQMVFPHVRPGAKWGEQEFTVARAGNAVDPTLQARGVFATGIGGRADIELYDDVVDLTNSKNPGPRENVMEQVEQTWLSRLEPNGKVLWVATLWHKADATSRLMDRPGWCTLQHAITDDCDGIDQQLFGAGDLSEYPLAPGTAFVAPAA